MPSPGKQLVSGATGDVLTVPAPTGPGAFIRVFSLALTASAASTVEIKSGSNVIASYLLGTGNDLNLADSVSGIMDCNPGEALVISNSAGTIRGSISYAVMGA